MSLSFLRSRRRRRMAPVKAPRQLAAVTVEPSEMSEPGAILDIQNLRTTFRTDEGEVNAVDDISMTVRRGRTTCIVGESGSGKSATARSIIQVVDNPGLVEGGRILFRADPDGPVYDVAALSETGDGIRSIRGSQIGLIFQEPMSSLSPVHTIGNQIAEVLELHTELDERQIRERVIAELEAVGIPQPAERIDSYTFQLSGGMRQRAMIAMALIARPSLLIADEPTTALDVTTQAQILDLLAELKRELSMTMIFITHDLGVVAEIADDVVVMRHGKVVETGPVEQIFHDPQHPYTQELLASLPQRDVPTGRVAPPEPQSTPERVEVSGAVEEAVRHEETAGEPLLRIEGLRMEFDSVAGTMFSRREKKRIVAVNDVSLEIAAGSTLGLVGESGCGKTTLGRCVMRAYQPTAGRIHYDDGDHAVDLATLSTSELRPYRRLVRMVFQDPYGSLNPRMTVREVIGEPLRVAGIAQGSELDDRVESMLERVGLRRAMASRYPHAFSGGERQRIGIARALITDPKLVVADEAVSALDVSVRTQILELLSDLQEELGLTYLFISHDLSVVERICDRVAVMYYGNLVEEGPAASVFTDPQHGYTQALLSAVPIPDPRLRGTRPRIVYRPDEAA
ncbi:ABC transporter ATP-binding protein [Pseudactinotalea suaedae]|uniref:ABC transporter ATP-binding protein n=1 Tax=Pseudactinotalea suaedae TaxID=1524924 RepID=UPI001F4F19BD|nr:ABC transporter ATP-binding protein [Pseudactinotalea suaedae]